VPTSAQTLVFLESRRLLDRAVRWLVSTRRSPLDVTGEIARLQPGVHELLPQLVSVLVGVERRSMDEHVATLVDKGVPMELAERVTWANYGFGLLDVLTAPRRPTGTRSRWRQVYFGLSERFQIDQLLSHISELPRGDKWQTLARMALRYDLYAALAALTVEVLESTESTATAAERVDEWEHVNAASIAEAPNAIGNVEDTPAELAALSVLLRQIRTLVKTSSANS
jgi:glutamate dehydrogenase